VIGGLEIATSLVSDEGEVPWGGERWGPVRSSAECEAFT
jgi:hypothetical protein